MEVNVDANDGEVVKVGLDVTLPVKQVELQPELEGDWLEEGEENIEVDTVEVALGENASVPVPHALKVCVPEEL